MARLRPSAAGLLACILALGTSVAATAQPAASLAELLLRKGVISEAEFRALDGDAALADLLLRKGVVTREELAAIPGLAPPPAPAPAPAAVTVNNEEGFRFKAPDGSTFQAGVLAQFDTLFVDDDVADFSNNTSFRRLRPNLAGTFLKDYTFRVSYELSGGGSVIDAYVIYTGLRPTLIQVGNFVQPFSFESVSSDKYNLFVERALPFAFAVSRAPGLALGHSSNHWSAHAAVFGEPPAVEDAGDEGWGSALRLTWAPVNAGDRLVHAGLSLMRRWSTQDNATEDGLRRTLRFRPRPESASATFRLIDTGEIPGEVQHYTAIDPELAAAWGPFSVQGEYMDVRVRRDEGPTLGFNGWYVQTAWSITGEPRPYREDRGVFDGVRPARNFGDGGWGAWELAARYSGMDLSDEDIDGGRQRSASLGLNFYPNPMLRASANVIQVLDVDGGPFDGDTPTLWQLRLQLGY